MIWMPSAQEKHFCLGNRSGCEEKETKPSIGFLSLKISSLFDFMAEVPRHIFRNDLQV